MDGSVRIISKVFKEEVRIRGESVGIMLLLCSSEDIGSA